MAVAKEYTINDPDDLLECPYESAHMIRAKRMQYHLMKCRKQHVTSEFARCPYNASHEVYSVELRFHMATCEDRQRVQGKIAQEHFEKDLEVKGCIETPGYRPLDVWGESWEQDIPSLPLGPPPMPAERLRMQEAKQEEVEISEAQTQGLTGRQLKQLYLRRKAEEAQRREAEQRKEGPGEKLRVPRQPSQSLAIHEKRQQQQHVDIYQKALKGQENRAIAFGRGSGVLQGGKPAQIGGAQVPASATQLSPNRTAAASIPLGRGLGHVGVGASHGVGFNATSLGIENIGAMPVSGGMLNVVNMQMADLTVDSSERAARGGRSLVNAEGDMSAVPLDNRVKIRGLGPQGKGRASAQNFVNMAGRGVGLSPPVPGQARGIIPFYQSASQPTSLPPSMQHAAAPGLGREGYPAVASLSHDDKSWNRTGLYATPAPTCQQPSPHRESSDDDGNEQFQDAMAWVGGGYGDDRQTSPMFLSSNTSLTSNPQLVGEFQDCGAFMKREDALKELKKIKKKLRQIDNLELKMREGQQLEPSAEAKWRSKAALIAQATHLQQTFGLEGEDMLD